MPISTFLFDLGNVLVPFSHARMFEQMGALYGMSGAEMAALITPSGLFQAFDVGSIDEEGFVHRLTELTGKEVPPDDLYLAGSDIFWHDERMDALIPALKAAGYRLVLISNTNAAHFGFLQGRFGVLDYFDDYVLSYEVKSAKPERRIYEVAAAKAHAPPEHCLYTDDRGENIEAGKAFGFVSELFTDSAQFVSYLRHRGDIDLSALESVEGDEI